MRVLRLLVVSLVLLGTVEGVQATTNECPVGDFDIGEIEEAARTAPSCARSLRVFKLCGSGASSDVSLGAIVTERCEAEFLSRSSKAEIRTYRRAQDRCARKYRHELGTMYRSFEAFCEADVARSYAERFRRRAAAQDR